MGKLICTLPFSLWLVVLGWALSLPANAQPVIKRKHIYAPITKQMLGTREHLSHGTWSKLAGANITWDLSGAGAGGIKDSLEITPAAGRAFDSSFTKASHAVEHRSFLTHGKYKKWFDYYTTTGGWGQIGIQRNWESYYYSNGGGARDTRVQYRYTSARGSYLQIPLPLHYGDSLHMTAYEAVDIESDLIREGEYRGTERDKTRSLIQSTVTVPAWGTLLLPEGPVSVLLVRRERVQADTTYRCNMQTGVWSRTDSALTFGGNPRITRTIYYDWVSADGRFLLVRAVWNPIDKYLQEVRFVITSLSVIIRYKPSPKPWRLWFRPVRTATTFDIDLRKLPGAVDALQLVPAEGPPTTLQLHTALAGKVLTLRPTGYAPGAYVWRAMSNGQVQATGKVVLGN